MALGSNRLRGPGTRWLPCQLRCLPDLQGFEGLLLVEKEMRVSFPTYSGLHGARPHVIDITLQSGNRHLPSVWGYKRAWQILLSCSPILRQLGSETKGQGKKQTRSILVTNTMASLVQGGWSLYANLLLCFLSQKLPPQAAVHGTGQAAW